MDSGVIAHFKGLFLEARFVKTCGRPGDEFMSRKMFMFFCYAFQPRNVSRSPTIPHLDAHKEGIPPTTASATTSTRGSPVTLSVNAARTSVTFHLGPSSLCILRQVVEYIRTSRHKFLPLKVWQLLWQFKNLILHANLPRLVPFQAI